MVVRVKGGDVRVCSGVELLDFLRGEKGDVEVIGPALFKVTDSREPGTEGNEERGVGWTFSTFDLDRFGERIDPAGWDFKRYMDNPVVQWAHCYDIPAIGRAGGVYADDAGLHGSVVFNGREYDPFGWGIGERVKAGVIRAGSVGFRPVEIEIPSKEEGKDGTTLIFRKQELLEFSICNVPANPWALRNEKLKMKNEELRGGVWGLLIKNEE
jgi:HK97 family phage prohead protease